MRRSIRIAIGVVAVSVAAAGIAVAQQSPDGGFRFGRGTPPSPEMMSRMLDGRIAGAKAALRLTSEQEKLWPAIEAVVRDGAERRIKAMADKRAAADDARKAGARPDLLERLELGSRRSADVSSDLKRFADALRPLHATLSDDQKRALAVALKPMRLGMGDGGKGERRGEWGGGRGHQGRMGG